MQNINSAKAYNMNGWILLKCKMKKKFRKKKYRLCWKTNIASSCMQREQQNVKKNKVCNTCFPVFLILVLFYFIFSLHCNHKKKNFIFTLLYARTYVRMCEFVTSCHLYLEAIYFFHLSSPSFYISFVIFRIFIFIIPTLFIIKILVFLFKIFNNLTSHPLRDS